jgi:glycosyltransferase involved in cell wall biosynthesis
MSPDTQAFLTIIMPFHHEEKNIAQTLGRLGECLAIPYEILLIHDDKDDPALPIIKSIQTKDPSIQVLLNKYRPGIPGAIRTGLGRSSGQYILFLVADDQGPIAIINPMFDLMEQGYDLVSGTRYAKGGSIQGGSFWARVISAWGNRLFCRLAHCQLSDPTCGIKMFRKDILPKVNLKADEDWAIAFELAVETQYHDLKVTELGFNSSNRMDGGESHFKIMRRVFKYGPIFLRGIFKLWKK